MVHVLPCGAFLSPLGLGPAPRVEPAPDRLTVDAVLAGEVVDALARERGDGSSRPRRGRSSDAGPKIELADEVRTLREKGLKVRLSPWLDRRSLTVMVVLLDPRDCIGGESAAGDEDQDVDVRRVPELDGRNGERFVIALVACGLLVGVGTTGSGDGATGVDRSSAVAIALRPALRFDTEEHWAA